ncbi:MAG: adenylate/guanylate cyclase domain-containing protein, partial [Rhodospirillales bacterium]|nr:adenylate/guanylate cyclase domain-containing protein [Rhodospirillales bacterium]
MHRLIAILGLRRTRIPERLDRAIRKQQDESERLIGWIQFAVLSMFGILYAVSPKTFSPDARFEPVPWVLAAYLGFTVLRLWLSYRRFLPGWFVAVSVVADILLLIGLIWSFHIQYAQPPSFYLKSPTVLYIFIFIALRALRFQTGYILLAGVSASAGWVALVLYVIYSDPSDPMITRDYITYMTSNAVLIGAEMDKVISILMVTLILVVAVGRARSLLIRAVTDEAAARSMARFFPEAVAKRIASGEKEAALGQGVARDAAILTIDIRGFTPLTAGMDPGDMIRLIAEYHARIVPVIRRHNGAVDKFLGDGILASFGAVDDNPQRVADAFRAIRDIMAEADTWNEARRHEGAAPIGVNAAIAAGEIIFGVIGEEDRLEYTVMGDPVNLAAKLEKHNKTEHSRALAMASTLDRAIAEGFDGLDWER